MLIREPKSEIKLPYKYLWDNRECEIVGWYKKNKSTERIVIKDLSDDTIIVLSKDNTNKLFRILNISPLQIVSVVEHKEIEISQDLFERFCRFEQKIILLKDLVEEAYDNWNSHKLYLSDELQIDEFEGMGDLDNGLNCLRSSFRFITGHKTTKIELPTTSPSKKVKVIIKFKDVTPYNA